MPRKNPAPASVPEHPGPQHNNPPEPVETASLASSAEQWAEYMARIFEQPNAKKAELLGAVGRFVAGYEIRRATVPGAEPIGLDKWSDDVAGRAGDLRDKLQAIVKQANDLHSLEKAPILAASRAVDGFKNNFIADLNSAVDLIKGRLTVYLTWKADAARRKAAEEAEELRKQAEATAATASQVQTPEAFDQAAEAFGQAAAARETAEAPKAELSRTYGTLGSVSSLKTRWKFFPEESDLMALARAVVEGKAPLEYLAFAEVRINFAVRSENLRTCPGLVVREESKA